VCVCSLMLLCLLDMGRSAGVGTPPVQPVESARGMIGVIEDIASSQTGAFLTYQGTVMEY
jgi:hypothetical protein